MLCPNSGRRVPAVFFITSVETSRVFHKQPEQPQLSPPGGDTPPGPARHAAFRGCRKCPSTVTYHALSVALYGYKHHSKSLWTLLTWRSAINSEETKKKKKQWPRNTCCASLAQTYKKTNKKQTPLTEPYHTKIKLLWQELLLRSGVAQI